MTLTPPLPILDLPAAYVAGEWINTSDRSFEVPDPFDGSILARLPDLRVDDTLRAIEAAARAQKEWARCSAKERAGVLMAWFYVQESVVEAFTQKLLQRVATLKLGRGTEEGVTMGPLIDENAVAKMEEHLADATAKGAKVESGSKRSDLGSTFFEPTVVSGATQDMLVAREGTFAPLAPIIAFEDEDEVLAMANASEFDLASYARDVSRIFKVAEGLEPGMVGVNTAAPANEKAPSGSVKQSGLGGKAQSTALRVSGDQVRRAGRALASDWTIDLRRNGSFHPRLAEKLPVRFRLEGVEQIATRLGGKRSVRFRD